MPRPIVTPSEIETLMLGWIKAHIAEQGIPPTYREIQAGLGISFGGTLYHLKILRQLGLVTWRFNKARSLRITKKGKRT